MERGVLSMSDTINFLNQAMEAGTTGDLKSADNVLAETESLLDTIFKDSEEQARKTSALRGGDLDGDDDEKEDPGDISGINDIYEAMYKKINVFLNSMLTTQAYAHFFMKNYKRDKMENYPDQTILKEMIKNKVRLVLPDDFI